MSESRLYLLKIQLAEIEPAIWRHFVVPASITLDRLHDVIQIVMGWNDSHRYQFCIGKKYYKECLDAEEVQEAKEEGTFSSDSYRLGDLIKQKGRKFYYFYDFGDYWEHELVITTNKSCNLDEERELLCLAGERACPPEDVGGVPGYLEFCEALQCPEHEEHESYMEWSGGDYDSECFDVNAVNMELIKYYCWLRDRTLQWKETK